jgi:osmotically-inducible protein OsmY
MKTAEELKNDVEQELRWEPSVQAEQIGVSVKNGVVELDGHVGSFFEKWGAESAALRVANVKSIASEIIVDLSSANARADGDIAIAAANQLNWNFTIPDTIKVMVTNGWVTLQGAAEWQYQRQEAERAVRPLRGVKGIINEIQLKPKMSVTGVKHKIEEALKRDAQIDSDHITVEANGNTVTLRGTVHSWRESQDAEHAAYDAPGVAGVTNLIEITY